MAQLLKDVKSRFFTRSYFNSGNTHQSAERVQAKVWEIWSCVVTSGTNLPDVRHICPKEMLAPNPYMAGTLFTSRKWPLKVEVLSSFKVIRVQPVDTDKKSMAIANSHRVCLSDKQQTVLCAH